MRLKHVQDPEKVLAAARERWEELGGMIPDREIPMLMRAGNVLLELGRPGAAGSIDAKILRFLDTTYGGRAIWAKPAEERIKYTPAEAAQLAQLAGTEAAATGLYETRKAEWFRLMRERDRLARLVEHAPLHEDAAGRRYARLPEGVDVSPKRLRTLARQIADAEKAYAEARDRCETARGELNLFKLSVQRRRFDEQYAAEQNTPEARERREAYDKATKAHVISDPISESLP